MADITTNTYGTAGFEGNDYSEVDAESHAPSNAENEVSSSQAYAGTYSHHCYTTTGASGQWCTVGSLITWPGGDIAYLRAYVYFDDANEGDGGYGDDMWLMGFCRGSYAITNQAWAAIRWNCADHPNAAHSNTRHGHLWLRDGDGYMEGDMDTTEIGPFSNNTWHEVELMADFSGSNTRAVVWVDGNEEVDWTNTGGAPTNPPDRFSIGGAYTANWHADNYADVYWDNIQCEDARIGGAAGAAPTLQRLRDIKMRHLLTR